MHSTSLRRSIASVVAATLAAVLIIGFASPARASQDDMPFQLRFPQDVSKTSFSNDWGQRRSGGRRHRGTDLMAEGKMVEVYAVADGVVAKVNERSRPGRYLIIEHQGGWDSLYIHLNDDTPGTDDGDAPWYLTLAPGIDEGVEVEAGQLIGWVGDSGNAEGSRPHTHFELHHNGSEVNPYPYLRDAFERDHAEYLRKIQVLENQIYGDVLIS